MEKYTNEARAFAEAIKTLAENENALDNFEYYLSLHFEIWLKKFANTPEGMAAEMNSFANIGNIG